MHYRISGRVEGLVAPLRLRGFQEDMLDDKELAAALDLFKYRPSNTDKYYKSNKGSKPYTSTDLRRLSWVKYCKTITIEE